MSFALDNDELERGYRFNGGPPSEGEPGAWS